jgi:predicted negative regulator of RcsB-dependent stress response
MSVYDAEEQQRIDALKDWWAQWGNLVYAITMVFLLGIAGSQGWKYYQKTQVVEAETLFVSAESRAGVCSDQRLEETFFRRNCARR